MPSILTRYVIDQVLRSFVLSLVTITAIFVLFMVMAEATRAGLSPGDILRIVPYIIPSSLPYTVPVALLFSVSVVYGRLASDNEIIAVKTAGLSVWTVLMPSWIFGLVLTSCLMYASSTAIPTATNQFRRILFQDFEDGLYKVLKKDNEFKGENGPFYIAVKDVDSETKTLIGATFKHRKGKDEPGTLDSPKQRKNKDEVSSFDFQIYAERAKIRFDVPNKLVRVELENSETTGTSAKPFVFTVNGRKELQYPIARDQQYKLEKRIQEKTDSELDEEQRSMEKRIRDERSRQAIAAAMWIASGRLEMVKWPEVGDAFKDYPYWQKKVSELETEKQLRRSLALGTLLFIWVGAPVGILFARRDFLSAFITCFLPIIGIYYPLTLLGMNLGKEGTTTPFIVYSGDMALFVVGLYIVLKIRRH